MYIVNDRDIIVEISKDFINILQFYKNNAIIVKKGVPYRFADNLKMEEYFYRKTFENKDLIIYERVRL